MIAQIWTIGHSTRLFPDFVAALDASGVKCLADVRVFPKSRRFWHFNKDALLESLATTDIRYEHFPELGGRRQAKQDSENTAWQDPGFRGYADYMGSAEFKKGVKRLDQLAQDAGPTAILCHEMLWWQCHRGLIADYLKVQGTEVIHILDAKKKEPHRFTTAARVEDGELSYRGLM